MNSRPMAIFDFYFNQVETPFDVSLFKEDNLKNGAFYTFEMRNGFFSSSSDFIEALSLFVRLYNQKGSFYITSVSSKNSYLELSNSIDKDEILEEKDKFDETLKYLPELYFDAEFNWCLYGCVDLFFFVLWCRKELDQHVSRSFLGKQFAEFNLGVDKKLFVCKQALSVFQLGGDQTVRFYENRLLKRNPYIYGDS